MKLKKIYVFIIVCAMFFFTNSLLIGASDELPMGPISKDSKIGIKQIMDAGIKDENFAQVIYQSFDELGYYGDSTKNVQVIMSEYNGLIDASNSNIHNIEGIEWLKRAKQIDFRNITSLNINQINDLTPLTKAYIMKTYNVSQEAAKKWFGSIGTNLQILLGGNLITRYGELCGRLNIEFIDAQAAIIPTDDLTMIKPSGVENWRTDFKIYLPEITRDNQNIDFDLAPQSTSIEFKNTGEFTNLDSEKLETEHCFAISDIQNSGQIIGKTITTAKDFLFAYRSIPIDENYESIGIDGKSISYQTRLSVRIYYPIKTTTELMTIINFRKSATNINNDKKVAGAKYYLYYSETDDRVNDVTYTTDINGEFILKEELKSGKYYLLEDGAPEEYLNNPEKYEFTVGQNTLAITGGDNNIKTSPGSIKARSDCVYIDRYSNDIKIETKIDKGYKLKCIQVSYFNHETQEYQTIEFATETEAERWINDNKGDEDKIGKIDGDVNVHGIFEQIQEDSIEAYDLRPETEFSFVKMGEGALGSDGVFKQEALPGVEFELKCTHIHTDLCNSGEDKNERCTCPHTDDKTYLTDEGCNWMATATSDINGNVNFNMVKAGIYRLTEKNTLSGYLPVDTTWTVTVKPTKEDQTILEVVIVEDNEDTITTALKKVKNNYMIENKAFHLKLIKVDAIGAARLEQAIFQLAKKDVTGEYNEQDAIVLVTDENGEVISPKLEIGEYRVKEIEAPDGYELINENIEFSVPFKTVTTNSQGIESEVSSDSMMVTFIFSNHKGIVLPNTGDRGLLSIVLLGIGIMTITVILLKKKGIYK